MFLTSVLLLLSLELEVKVINTKWDLNGDVLTGVMKLSKHRKVPIRLFVTLFVQNVCFIVE